jgi:glycosyltransferase involved in cell wall biosynthesis
MLSIITVTKDDLEGIIRTIKSTKILREEYGIKQIVVDSSTNEVRNNIEKLLKEEKNIQYVWQKPSGISAAFNFGLSLSTEDWIWFLNGGDEVHPKLNISLFLYLLSNCTSEAIIFQLETSQTNETYEHPPMWMMWPPLHSWIPHPATITRRNLYRMYGNFNESFKIAMDLEFFVRCFSKNVIADTISLPVAIFDLNGVSNTQISKVSSEVIKIIKMHLWTIIKIWIYNGRLIYNSYRYNTKNRS